MPSVSDTQQTRPDALEGPADDGTDHEAEHEARTSWRERERRLLRDLEQPRDVFANIGPNWYASVMGTGIVGGAAATLPIQFPGLRTWGTVIWALAAVWLVVLSAAWLVHWVRHTEQAKGHATNPTMAQFWGAPAMGLMTIGLGFAQFGPSLIGSTAALSASWVLWSLGTALGLFTTAWIPYMMITRDSMHDTEAFGGWLMPVVPPMVSAANGSLLIGHLPAGAGKETMLLACYAMFGISLFATLAILPQIWNRLVLRGTGGSAVVPTLWIVLGPLGQSVTATNLLANQARGVVPEPYATGAEVLGMFYGFATWGFAMVWIGLAAAVTVRTIRQKMPFALTWWSFTFPVGTCVTGTSALAARTHVPAVAWWAMALYAFLVFAWLVVAVRTAHRAVVRGDILAPA